MDTFTFLCSLPTLTKKSLKTIHALAQTYRSRSTLNAHVSTSFDKAQERGRSALISSVANLHKARIKSTIASPDNLFESWNNPLKLSGCNCSSTCCDGGSRRILTAPARFLRRAWRLFARVVRQQLLPRVRRHRSKHQYQSRALLLLKVRSK